MASKPLPIYPDWLPRVTLGSRIASLRRQRGLSTRDMSRYGVSAATVSRIERGHEPSLSALIGIANALHVDLVDLLAGVDLSDFTPKENTE
jgi:transcriptional regulator with XRE-family HTH domain